MQRLTLGGLLCLGLANCRTDSPPSIEICEHDGLGAECVERDGTHVYKVPSELKTYWMTNQEDMKSFAEWCYQARMPNEQKN